MQVTRNSFLVSPQQLFGYHDFVNLRGGIGVNMNLKRYVTEMGMGVDVHGQDYNLAAKRAVSDAIRHSSLNFFKTLNKSPEDMYITVKIGIPNPSSINRTEIAKELPYGTVTVEPEKGGIEVPNDAGDDAIVIANAVIIVYLEE